jgi:hypothetical protein
MVSSLQPLNVKVDHGAVGDGTTNDAPAFQAFFNACVSTGRNGYIPPGDFRIASKITINYGALSTEARKPVFFGDGPYKSRLLKGAAGTTFVVLEVLGPTTGSGVHGDVLADLSIEAVPAPGSISGASPSRSSKTCGSPASHLA